MKITKLILAIVLLLAGIIACNKDEGPTKDTLDKETLCAKWVTDGTGVYESFEFNESGNYIVVKNTTLKSTSAEVVLFGTYDIIDNKTIILSDFGKIVITEIDDNTISFSIFLDSNPGNKIIINATKQEEMNKSTRTDLLCRTWEMVTIDGEPVAGTDMELIVLFSAAGTYFVSYTNSTDENDGGLALWAWKDVNEIILCYSWEGDVTCTGTNEVVIAELTVNKLQINEDGTIYVLRPVINTKSAIASSEPFSHIESRKGFFGK